MLEHTILFECRVSLFVLKFKSLVEFDQSLELLKIIKEISFYLFPSPFQPGARSSPARPPFLFPRSRKRRPTSGPSSLSCSAPSPLPLALVHMGPTSPTRPCSWPAWRPKAAAHFHLPFLLLSLRGRAHSLAGHFPLPRRARGSPCITASPSSLRFKALALMAFKAELHALALTALSRTRSLPIIFHAVPFSPLCCCRSSPQPRYPVLSPRSSDAIAIAAGKPHRISQRLQVPLPLHFALQFHEIVLTNTIFSLQCHCSSLATVEPFPASRTLPSSSR